MKTILLLGVSIAAFGQTVAYEPLGLRKVGLFPTPAGAGSGTVTSAVIAGTANQITASGTCTITTTGTCTLSLPSGLLLPGSLTTGSGTTAGGAVTAGNATGDTAASYFEANSGDGASNTEPGYLKLWSSHSTKRKAALFPCTNADGVLCIAGDTPVADASNSILVSGGALGTPSSGVGTNLTGIPNGATTAASANTASAIVARDGSGNFSAGTITASLTGTASGNSTTIASGTSALGTSSIASQACATVVTTAATGTLSTDAIIWTPNASIKAVTGYAPLTTGGLSIAAYPTADNVSFDVCNWSSGSISPGAVTLNWRVVR